MIANGNRRRTRDRSLRRSRKRHATRTHYRTVARAQTHKPKLSTQTRNSSLAGKIRWRRATNATTISFGSGMSDAYEYSVIGKQLHITFAVPRRCTRNDVVFHASAKFLIAGLRGKPAGASGLLCDACTIVRTLLPHALPIVPGFCVLTAAVHNATRSLARSHAQCCVVGRIIRCMPSASALYAMESARSSTITTP